MLSQKISLVGVVMFPRCDVVENRSIKDQEDVKVYACKVEDWQGIFPKLFSMEGRYVNSQFLQEIKMCHKEVVWKVFARDIHVGMSKITYDVGQVTETDALRMVEKLGKEGVITELQT